MASILAEIGTKVGQELKTLDVRLTSAEAEIVSLGGQIPPPTGDLSVAPVQWTNLTEINLSGEKVQNTSFDPPPLGLGVEVEVLTSWSSAEKTASVGEIYKIDLIQADGRMRLTGNGQSLFATQSLLATRVKTLHPSQGQVREPYLWSVNSGTLDQAKLSEGIIKGENGSVGVHQMFTTPLAVGTKIVVKATRSDFGTGGVSFKHLKNDGKAQGGNISIPISEGFVAYEVVTSDMHGIRFSTNNGAHEISSVSAFQGVVSGGSVQANGNGGIEKISGSDGFNAGASSTNFIEGNSNGYVQFQWGQQGTSQQIGLTYVDDDYGNVEPFMMELQGNGNVFTNGSNSFNGGAGWATQGDYFRIRHYASDNTIRFQRREEVYSYFFGTAEVGMKVEILRASGGANLWADLAKNYWTIKSLTVDGVYVESDDGVTGVLNNDWRRSNNSDFWEVVEFVGTDYVTFHTHSDLSNGNNLYVDTSLFHVGSKLNDVLLAR